MEFSTKKFIDSTKWSDEMSKIKGNTENARSLNEYLDLMRSKIFDIQMELIHRNELLTIEVFKNRLLGIQDNQRIVIPIFQDHNNKIKELVGKEYAPGTLELYNTSLKHTIEFLEWKYSVSDIDIKDIDHSFITEYEFFLRSVRKCANNTAIKYIKNFKKITDAFAHSMQWSRRFIGLKVYMSLLIYGWEGYEETIDHQFEMGFLLKEKLKADNWEILNDTDLPIVCFGKTDFINNDNQALHICNKIVQSGNAWISVYKLGKVNTLRACITNYLTQDNDVNNLITLLRLGVCFLF